MKVIRADGGKATYWNSHEYQKKAVKFLVENKQGALFLDPGLGKTAITLSALVELKKQGKLERALIVAPLLVCYNVWGNEIAKWEQFQDLTISICHGKNKQEAIESNSDIMIINYEGLQWLFSLQGGKLNTITRIEKAGFNVLIFDELSKMKNHASKRFKTIKALLPAFERRWGLTGSPVANSLMDLFAECYMLDEGQALGKYITHYRFKYFDSVGYQGYVWKAKTGAMEKVFDKIKHLALRMSADDYLDMPALNFRNIVVELDKKTRGLYDKLENDFIVDINNNIITASNVAVKLEKCLQFCSGGVYCSELDKEFWGGNDYELVHNLKIEALLDFIDELQGKQVIIAYKYKHERDRLKEALKGRNFAFLDDDENVVDRWNKGDIQILVVQPASAGHGLNLQGSGCSHLVWLTPTWSFELYDQTNRRIYRQGNESQRIFIHHILIKKSVDEVVMKALKYKDNTQNKLFELLKEYGLNDR